MSPPSTSRWCLIYAWRKGVKLRAVVGKWLSGESAGTMSSWSTMRGWGPGMRNLVNKLKAWRSSGRSTMMRFWGIAEVLCGRRSGKGTSSIWGRNQVWWMDEIAKGTLKVHLTHKIWWWKWQWERLSRNSVHAGGFVLLLLAIARVLGGIYLRCSKASATLNCCAAVQVPNNWLGRGEST